MSKVTLTPDREGSDASVERPSGSDGEQGGRGERREREPTDHSRALRITLAVAIPVGTLAIFLALAWSSERFRQFVSRVAPYMQLCLYGAAAALLALAFLRRFRATDDDRPRRVSPWRLATWPLGLSAAIVAYLVPLVDNWQTSRRSLSAVAGVMPWNDANDYFVAAQQLVLKGRWEERIGAWNSRRPLNAAFLASRLLVTNLDLRSALVIQAILLGVACFLAARVVARDLGLAAGVALFAGLYSFASFGVETTLSESLGVTLGALAFTVLWNAVRDRQAWLAVAGLFMLSLAFDARAGTFLLVLALPLWFARSFRGSRRLNMKLLGATVAAVIAGFSISYLLAIELHGEPRNVNGNTYSSLYGLATGDTGYQHVYTDYPEIGHLTEVEANVFIRRKVIEQVIEHPATALRGVGRSGRDYLDASRNQILAPVEEQPFARDALYIGAALIGALVLIRRWRSSSWRPVLLDLALFGSVIVAVPVLFGVWGSEAGHYPTWLALVTVALGYLAYIVLGTGRARNALWCFVGVSSVAVCASVPLVPIIDAGPRVYAATAPFFAVAIAGAVAIIDCALARSPVTATRNARLEYERPWWSVALAGGIAAAAVVVTPLAALAASSPEPPTRTCPDGQRAEAFTGGVAIKIVAPGAKRHIDEIDLTRSNPPAPGDERLSQGLAPGKTILSAVALSHPHWFPWMILVDGHVDAPGRGVLLLCAKERLDPSKLPLVFNARPLQS
jgi:hypothetical protein